MGIEKNIHSDLKDSKSLTTLLLLTPQTGTTTIIPCQIHHQKTQIIQTHFMKCYGDTSESIGLLVKTAVLTLTCQLPRNKLWPFLWHCVSFWPKIVSFLFTTLGAVGGKYKNFMQAELLEPKLAFNFCHLKKFGLSVYLVPKSCKFSQILKLL